MKYTIERLTESRVAIDVELDTERVEKALDRACRRIAQRARIPGFRPGKAPRYVIEARLGRSAVYQEAADELVRQAYHEILERKEFDPVAEAGLENLSLDPFTFRVIVPVRPTVTLGDYRALRFAEEGQTVGDEDVETALRKLQEERTVWKEPGSPRPARLGDRLVVDMVGRSGDREIERRESAEIALGDRDLLPGFSEGLEGVEVGQVRELPVTLPEGLEDETLAGQPAVFTVAVRTIKEPEVPALDDEFARSLGKEETLEELRARLRREMEEAARSKARDQMLEQIMAAVSAGATVDMPEVLVEQEVSDLFKEQENRLRAQHLSMAQFFDYLGKTEEQYRQELREIARERVQRSLVVRELLQAEGLTVAEEDIQAEVDRLMESRSRPEETPEDREKLRKGLFSSAAVRQHLEPTILSRKLEERLLAIARGEWPQAGVVAESGGEEVAASAAEGAAVEEPSAEPAAEETAGEQPGPARPKAPRKRSPADQPAAGRTSEG